MPKTLITGATGFIGSAVARVLINSGRDIRVLLRSEKYIENLDGLKFEKFKGDLADFQSLRSAVKGCDSVFHVAALYLMWTLEPEYIFKTNVEGTRNVLRAAMEAGIEKVVYTSSVAAIGIRDDGKPSDETVEWNLEWINDPYVKSKHQAMQIAKEYFKKGLNIVTVCPTAPLGVGDIKPTPTGQMICDFLNGKTPVYFKGGFNLVDVEDVAIGHLLAEEKGKSGEIYILGGANTYLKDMYKMLSDISGVRTPGLFLPNGVDLFSAWTLETIANVITKKPPLITLEGCRMVKLPPFYDHSKAKKELGYKSRPLEDTLKKSIDYFHERGYAKRR
ncbi:MAG: hopanoid-associated sugar epimerase [bacterium]